MTRTRAIAWLVTTSMAVPGLSYAQSGQNQDPRVRVQPRVVIEQQRERDRRGVSQGREEATEKLNRSFKIGGSGELLVSNLSGDITITRGSGNEVTFDVTKVARARTVEDAKEMLPLVTVDFVERGNRIEARVQYPHGREQGLMRHNVNVSVVYTITAPAGTRVSAKSLSGNISVTDIKGELSAVSLSGKVAIASAERLSSAKSTSGDVEIANVNNGDMPFEANSMSGNVIVRQVKAPRMELGTVSGNVILTDVQVARVEAQSLSGNVEFTSPFAKGGRYDFTSHAGTVRIVVVGGSGFEIDANTFSGTIQSDPSLNLKKEEEETGRPGRRQRTLRAVYGDGSAFLDITTFSGSVVLTRK